MSDQDDEAEPESEYRRVADAFVEALSRGDEKVAAELMRTLKTLEGVELELVADLLDGSRVSRRQFPYRLVFKKRTAGRPYDHLRKKAEQFSIGRSLEKERAKPGRKKAAMTRMQERLELKGENNKRKAPSRSTLYKVLGLRKKSSE